MILAALLLTIACTPNPTFTPTPTLRWVAPTTNTDGSPVVDLAGYILYLCADSGQCNPLVTFPCEWYDLDEDGFVETRFCRGSDLDIAVQRYVNASANTAQTFKVAAYDFAANVSDLSASVSVCMSPVCVRGGPPCN